MMKKIFFLFFTVVLVVSSCKKDDDGIDTIPPRDRGEEALAALAEIETFLETHFYNYEEFQNPPAGFDYKIRFDTIAGDNADKTPLIDQVSSKPVTDREEEGIVYNLYYLKVIEGEGEQVQFPDITTLTYEGRTVADLTLFDSSVVPVRFDLTGIINGLQSALIEFKTATGSTSNPDGTVSFENYGVGAVFIPSGLGYFQSSPSFLIPEYAQLIFTFQVLATQEGDQDNDGVLTIHEDLNENGIEEDDDTDGDGIPNYADNNDDNDAFNTAVEIRNSNGEIPADTNGDGKPEYPDRDNDGIPDYLDADE